MLGDFSIWLGSLLPSQPSAEATSPVVVLSTRWQPWCAVLPKQGAGGGRLIYFRKPALVPLSTACTHSCPLKNAGLLSVGGF